MKKLWTVWLVCLLLYLAACGTGAGPESPTSGQSAPAAGSIGEGSQGEPAGEVPQAGSQEETEMKQYTFYLTVGEETFAAAFADNVGAQGLKELLAQGPVTIRLRDYGGFEKVGVLGQSLPASDVLTTTQAGDIVLYQGDQIVLFYGSNSWSYTRLGQISDLSGWEEALGPGDVSVTLSLAGSRE